MKTNTNTKASNTQSQSKATGKRRKTGKNWEAAQSPEMAKSPSDALMRLADSTNAAKPPGGWTVEDLYPHDSLVRFRDFVRLKDYSPRTQKTYVSHPRMLGAHFSCDPAKIIEEQVEEYFLFLRQDKCYASSSMRQAIAGLRMFYHDFLKIEPEWDIFSKIKVRAENKLPQVLTREEVYKIFNCVQRDRFRTSLRLIYHCGLRLSEALSIEVRDIDGQAGRIHIRNGKGGKDRYVPIGQGMIKELRRFWSRHQHPKFLFPGLGKGYKFTSKCREVGGVEEEHEALKLVQNAKARMSGATVQNAFKRALAASGVKKAATPHTLRNEYS